MNIQFSHGPAASNTYLYDGNNLIAQFTYDWSYKSIYFKEFPHGRWITYTYSEIQNVNNQYFKQLATYTFNKIPLEK